MRIGTFSLHRDDSPREMIFKEVCADVVMGIALLQGVSYLRELRRILH